MISNLVRGILSIKNQTVLKAEVVLLTQRTGQSHPESPRTTKNYQEFSRAGK